MKTIQNLAIAFLIAGLLILAYFLIKASVDGLTVSLYSNTDYQVTGQFGDFVGGVIGTFFALSGTLLIFLNFREQTKENKRSAFEASFFEMIRLYRANVSELKYSKPKNKELLNYENRHVLREIAVEFNECYREVRKFSNSTSEDYYYNSTYKKRIKELALNIGPEIDLIEMAAIDIAFMIIFYGLERDGEQIIRDNFARKYHKNYYFKLLQFIKLKPKSTREEPNQNWKDLKDIKHKQFHEIISDIYTAKEDPKKLTSQHELAEKILSEMPYERYYGGHQIHLGHYFRHLFQSYKYLNNHPDLSPTEKYEYGKLYRSQLSTDEQTLLLVNSISSLGMNWEFTIEKSGNIQIGDGLITTYNLIKNLPGAHLSGIRYKKYYPRVNYESDEGLH